jgi:hypothetical protein
VGHRRLAGGENRQDRAGNEGEQEVRQPGADEPAAEWRQTELPGERTTELLAGVPAARGFGSQLVVRIGFETVWRHCSG